MESLGLGKGGGRKRGSSSLSGVGLSVMQSTIQGVFTGFQRGAKSMTEEWYHTFFPFPAWPWPI